MADDNKYNDNDRNPKKGGDFKMQPRAWVVWVALTGIVIVLLAVHERMEYPGEVLSQYKFQQIVDSNQVFQATINYSPQSPFLTEVTGKYYRTDNAGNRLKENDRESPPIPFRTKARLIPDIEKKLLSLPQFEVKEPNTMLLSVVWSVLPIVIIIVLVWCIFIRQIKMAGEGGLSFGKSKVPLLARGRNKTRFKQVAGI